MKRIDWQLVPPVKPGEDAAPLLLEMAELERSASVELLTDTQMDRLVTLENLYDTVTISTCAAVGAPRVDDDPDWETRAIDEYADSDVEIELEEFLALRRSEPDCENCPYAQPYSLFPMDPCEFSAGPLLAVVLDPSLHALATATMAVPQMLALADGLQRVIDKEAWQPIAELDALDYLKKTVFFLRFWARHDFGLEPVAIDQLPPIITEDEIDEGEAGGPPPFLH
ncbi:MAG: hypothetical protein ACI9MR_001060 [Myxococcota bacterium]|jgi:hypothetical protein